MRLPILALLSRSLRVESRTLSTYGMRLGLVAVIFIVLLIVHASSMRLAAAGRYFLEPIVYINFIFVSLAGLGYFSSAITEEKEEETLGLLKMSSLNPVSILLGKSTSRLVGGVFLLLAQFPFTLLAVTLGGVSLTQVFAVYATLLAYMVFLANLALLSSVVCQRTTSAGGMTLLLGLGLFLGAPILLGILPLLTTAMSGPGWLTGREWYYRAPLWLATKLVEANPFVRLMQAMATGFDEHPIGFQVVSNLAGGLGLFVLAWAAFGYFTREQKTAAPARGVLFRRTSPMRWLGIGRPWRMAVAWKDFHFLAGGRLMIVGKLLGIALLTLGIAWLIELTDRRRVTASQVGGILMVGSLCVAGLDIILHAARMFQMEVKWGTLPDIAQLPISMQSLAYRKVLGYLPALTPYAVAFLIGAVLNPRDFGEGVEEIFSEAGGWHSLFQFVAFVHFVAYLSLIFKRVGAVVAFFTWIIGNWLGMAILFLIARPSSAEEVNAVYILMAVGLGALTILLHALTIARLRKLAGQ